ncbi:MAG: cupin domain-containing protein, partial [Sinobacterium sp.]
MKIAADFSQREVKHSTTMPWVDSPMAGVARKPLDRVGNEVARATTVVRYAPGSHFSAHAHAGGEEFIVLE